MSVYEREDARLQRKKCITDNNGIEINEPSFMKFSMNVINNFYHVLR